MNWKISGSKNGLRGTLRVPPDKSVTHRAVMFGGISSGELLIRNFLFGEDCLRTLDAFRVMGVRAERDGDDIFISGKGLRGLIAPPGELYLGNSGTTMRVMSGILAGQDFDVRLRGDDSLSSRPMLRVVEPLEKMGAKIGTGPGGRPPLEIKAAGKPLKAIDYITPVASAQVKSCILAAGMYAEGVTSVTEPFKSRDHTERMLEYLSADIKRTGMTTFITGSKELVSRDITVPGDISSAAFFIVGALILPGSEILLKGVGTNPTRTGLLTVLERMGADISIDASHEGVEPSGDLKIKYSRLRPTVVKPREIPLMIDEVPVLMIAALMAEGRTEIQGIGELKVKESDRIRTMAEDLSRLGAVVREDSGILYVEGLNKKPVPGTLDSFGDHRVAMSMAIASLLCDGESEILNTECVDTSYPGFLEHLGSLLSEGGGIKIIDKGNGI